MWDKFETRFEAEHFLARQVRAQEIVLQFTAPDAPDDSALRAVLGALAWRDLQAFSYRLVELIGPEQLQAAGGPGWTPSSPREARLFELLHITMPLVRERTPDQTSLTTADMPAAERSQKIDERIGAAAKRAIAQQDSPEDVISLRTALRDYRALLAGQALSPGGRHLLRSRIAFMLDCLGRTAETRHADEIAEAYFVAAQAEYEAVSDQSQAAVCVQKGTAAADRQQRDADQRMRRLLAAYTAAEEPSLEHVEALLGLAELASGHGDWVEVSQRLDPAVEELGQLGYPPPGKGGVKGGVETAVGSWIDAIPPGDGEDPLHFTRYLARVLTLQELVAKLQIYLAPDATQTDATETDHVRAAAALANDTLFGLGQIVGEIPQHARAVEERLQARLEGRSATDGEASSQHDDWLVVVRSIDRLLKETEALPTDEATLARLRAESADCVERARGVGLPVVLAQALEMQARVHVVDHRPDAAITVLEDAYKQVAGLSGDLEQAQAVQAASSLAKAYMEIPALEGAGAAAGRAIALVERDRYKVSAPFQAAAYLGAHLDAFSIGIYCAWQLKDYDTMLQRMELSKARVSVRNMLRAGTAPSTAQFDQELRDLTAAIHQDIPALKREELRARRHQLWDLRAVALRDVAEAAPAVTLAGVQAALAKDEAVVYYYWLRPAVLLVVTINSDGMAIERMKLTDDEHRRLLGMVEGFGQPYGSNLGLDDAFIAPLARVLTPAEGAQLLQNRRRLFISPHRLLHWYPFAAMPYGGRPLVQSFAIRHVPNLASLAGSRTRPRRGPTRVAAVTVSTFPGRELEPLPQVVKEAEEAVAAYRAAGVAATVLSEPSRAGFLAAVQDGTLTGTRCLHMATHGHSVAMDAPMESTLELADGSLDGFEIAAAGLDSDLVVLAACDAGQLAVRARDREEQPGDEMFGLPAAFLESGCSGVVAPVWPADTEATARIIAALHRHLASGQPADIALALAQREYLDSAGYLERHAYYWAPYHLIAVGRPPLEEEEHVA